MKKRILVVLLSMFCVSLFCQSGKKSYSQIMDSAKKYTDNKKWIHAMGCYMDVYSDESFSFEERINAYEGYSGIAEQIKKGKPGFGEFNAFSHLEQWEALLDEFEAYSKEIIIVYPVYGKLEKKSVDYDTRNINYSAKIEFRYSNKYLELLKIILSGLDNGAKKEWHNTDFQSTYDYEHGNFLQRIGYGDPGEAIYFHPDINLLLTLIVEDTDHNLIGKKYSISKRIERNELQGYILKEGKKFDISYRGSHFECDDLNISCDSVTAKKIESGAYLFTPTLLSCNGIKIENSALTEFLTKNEIIMSFDVSNINKEIENARIKKEEETRLAKEKQQREEEEKLLAEQQAARNAELEVVKAELSAKYPDLVNNIELMIDYTCMMPISDVQKFVKYINIEITQKNYEKVMKEGISFSINDIKSEDDLIQLGMIVRDADFTVNLNIKSPTHVNIPSNTFSNCNKLHYFSISRVDRLSEKAFNNCPLLQLCYFYEVKNVDKNAFENCPRLGMYSIRLPKELKSKIKNDYKEYIKNKYISFW